VDRAGEDFSGIQVRRSLLGSLDRLGADRLQLVYLHDPEHIGFAAAMAPGGPVEALLAARNEGLVQHVGVAGGPVALLSRFLRTGAFEVLITHNRWTLVDRSAGDLIDEAAALGVAVVNGAAFGGGILAQGSASRGYYAYRPADAEVLRRVRKMEAACAAHGVPLAAAALQFSTRDRRIASTIVGMSRPDRVDQVLDLASRPIPASLWTELDSLAAPEEAWLW
jgi:D-threo-aldose 1-dehydrogenase